MNATGRIFTVMWHIQYVCDIYFILVTIHSSMLHYSDQPVSDRWILVIRPSPIIQQHTRAKGDVFNIMRHIKFVCDISIMLITSTHTQIPYYCCDKPWPSFFPDNSVFFQWSAEHVTTVISPFCRNRPAHCSSCSTLYGSPTTTTCSRGPGFNPVPAQDVATSILQFCSMRRLTCSLFLLVTTTTFL